MTIIAGKVVELLVGDGDMPTETFSLFKGTTLTRLEVTQQLLDSPAIAGDSWITTVAVARRRLAVNLQALAYDHDAADRLRGVAFSGAPVNFQLTMSDSETWQGAGMVTQYEEDAQAGDAKRITLRLESVTSLSLR